MPHSKIFRFYKLNLTAQVAQYFSVELAQTESVPKGAPEHASHMTVNESSTH